MSHSTVLVIGSDVESALAPFNENDRVPEYRRDISDDRLAEIRIHIATNKAIKNEDLNKLVREYLTATLDKPYEERGRLRLEHPLEKLEEVATDKDKRGHIVYSMFSDDFPAAKEVKERLMPTNDEILAYDSDYKIDEAGKFYELSTYNPKSKWDWYTVGGRWTGFFKLKAGKHGGVGEPGAFGLQGRQESRIKGGFVDRALKGDIDWEAMRAEARKEANKHYDELEAALNGQALPPRFSDFMKENFPKDLAGARKAFNDLPVVKALDAAGIHTFMDDYQDLYGPDRAAYVERAAKSVGVTFAVLKNGEWHEKGHMGWFGCVSGEKKEEDWEAAFWKLLEDVPDTELLTVVDVHI